MPSYVCSSSHRGILSAVTRIFVTLVILLAAVALTAPVHAQNIGILLLAHGTHDMGHGAQHHADHAPRPNPWQDNVTDIARVLNETQPTEVAFGMADPAAIQDAVDRLESRGVRTIVAVPLFISSHSPIIGNFRYILGLQNQLGTRTSLKKLDRIKSKAKFLFSPALDADPLVSDILFDRAKAATRDAPSMTNLVIIAHGPNDEEDNKLWLANMEKHAAYLRGKGFRLVEVLTHRNDASLEIKSEARRAFRARVEAAGRVGTTVVLPLLLSEGGIEREVEGDLDGLKFVFAKPLAPHPNLARWVSAQFQASISIVK
jgi:sirohydrochlorin ferrochelatase